MKTLIHYIHGFNSSIHAPDGRIASEKVRRIADWCADNGCEFVPENIDYCNIADIQRFLDASTDADSPDEHIYMGTSLGGLMALVRAKAGLWFGDKAVLINPALLPMRGHFHQQGGQVLTNYVNGKQALFSQEALAFISSLQENCLVPTRSGFDFPFTQVHLALNDDVLPVHDVAGALKPFPAFEIFTYPTGGHRFDDPLALENVLRQLRVLINTCYPLVSND